MIGKLTEKLQFTDYNNATNAKNVLFSMRSHGETTSSRKDFFCNIQILDKLSIYTVV